MGHLILVRHAKSQWNALGKWTGLHDISLSDEGRAQAAETAVHLKGIDIHKAYTSALKRAKETLEIIVEYLGISAPVIAHPALNERDYGIFTGENKWGVKEKIGEAEFQKIRRGWDTPIEGGETLKDVHDRVVPYFKEHVLPDVKAGKNALIVAHGNSLRALVKHLEDISDEAIADVEIGVGEAHVYRLDKEGKIISKHIRAENAQKGKI